MKKAISFILAVALLINLYTVTANATVGIGPDGNMTVSEPSLAVDLYGTVFADIPLDIISVVMPTRIFFNVFPDRVEWNHILSPNVIVMNVNSSRPVSLSIDSAVISSPGVTFTDGAPRNTVKEVRLGIAPVPNINSATSVIGVGAQYLLNAGTISDLGMISNVIPFNSVTYRVYGDASPMSLWTDGEALHIQTVFKVVMP
jgi:hypothetical protein